MNGTWFARWSPVVAAIIAVIALNACGGGSAPNPNPGQNPGPNPPGAVGNINNPPANPADVPVPEAIEASWPQAPLGLNPAYNPQPAEATVASHTTSKAGSELGAGQNWAINWVTVAPYGEEPDPEATDLSFTEGDKINLWVEYEVRPNMDFSRNWNIPSLGLDYTEGSVPSGVGGVFQASFEINLAIGSATEEARFTSVIGAPKSTSLVVIPNTESLSVAFEILPMDTLTPIHYPADGEAQMGWEDLLTGSDYDYNDMVARMTAIEWRNSSNELVQIDLWVKAVARSAGYNADWQFNMDAAFPGASVVAIVDQYYADGTRHGDQEIWYSGNGASVPVFAPTREALPNPPDHSYATNGVAGTTFIDGDYATVKITLDVPMAQGTYTPVPYEPQLKVYASGGNTYNIGLWRQPGDDVDSNGRPLAFIIPDIYAWPLEGKRIWNVYPGYNGWITWINNPVGPPPTPNWWDTAPQGTGSYFLRSLFLPWPI
jgi:LruC domain-containing protein